MSGASKPSDEGKTFQECKTFEQRKQLCESLRETYPDRIPIIVQRAAGSNLPVLDKKKFLVPHNMTVGNFSFVIRRRLLLQPQESLFLSIGNVFPAPGNVMNDLHNRYKDEDGLLYLDYTSENSFGAPQ